MKLLYKLIKSRYLLLNPVDVGGEVGGSGFYSAAGIVESVDLFLQRLVDSLLEVHVDEDGEDEDHQDPDDHLNGGVHLEEFTAASHREETVEEGRKDDDDSTGDGCISGMQLDGNDFDGNRRSFSQTQTQQTSAEDLITQICIFKDVNGSLTLKRLAIEPTYQVEHADEQVE